VNTVNDIPPEPKTSRLFSKLCDELSAIIRLCLYRLKPVGVRESSRISGEKPREI